MRQMRQTSSWMAPYGSDPEFDKDSATIDEVCSELSRLASAGNVGAGRALATEALVRFPGDGRLTRWAEVLAPPVVIKGATRSAATSGEEVRAWLLESGSHYLGKWVVVDRGQLVASGATLEEVQTELTGHPNAVALQVFEELVHDG